MNYPQQPGQYPHHRPPQQPAEGIAVTTEYFPLGFMMALFKPKILIDGYEAPVTGWGRTVLPARSGQHRVHVHVPYFLPSQIGPADILVDVYPGQLVELEYKAPLWAFSPGSLGSPPQSFNGLGITLAVMATFVVVPFLFLILLIIIGI